MDLQELNRFDADLYLMDAARRLKSVGKATGVTYDPDTKSVDATGALAYAMGANEYYGDLFQLSQEVAPKLGAVFVECVKAVEEHVGSDIASWSDDNDIDTIINAFYELADLVAESE